jgi:hypothetical protein
LFVPVDIEYLFKEDDSRVVRLTRHEDVDAMLPPSPSPATVGSKLAGVGCLAVFVLLNICSIVGFVDMLGWFFKK